MCQWWCGNVFFIAMSPKRTMQCKYLKIWEYPIIFSKILSLLHFFNLKKGVNSNKTFALNQNYSSSIYTIITLFHLETNLPTWAPAEMSDLLSEDLLRWNEVSSWCYRFVNYDQNYNLQYSWCDWFVRVSVQSSWFQVCLLRSQGGVSSSDENSLQVNWLTLIFRFWSPGPKRWQQQVPWRVPPRVRSIQHRCN